MPSADPRSEPSLLEIVREWGRIGCIGFGGPPAHVVLLRELCVERRGWLTDAEFERALAATNMLPGPASTQLAIYCAWRLRGGWGWSGPRAPQWSCSTAHLPAGARACPCGCCRGPGGRAGGSCPAPDRWRC